MDEQQDERENRLLMLCQKAWPQRDGFRIQVAGVDGWVFCVDENGFDDKECFAIYCVPDPWQAMETALLALSGTRAPWAQQLAERFLADAVQLDVLRSVSATERARVYRDCAGRLMRASAWPGME
jgi:hypothetical protein